MPMAEVGGQTVYFRDSGDESLRPLIMLHGLYADSTTLKPVAQLLDSRFRVIRPDSLGHGRSTHPGNFTITESGRAIVGLVRRLKLRSAVLMGISMGAYLAAQVAADDPARISHLILVSGKAHGAASSTVTAVERLRRTHQGAGPQHLASLADDALFSAATSAAQRQAILQAVSPSVVLTDNERAAAEKSLIGFDARSDLRRITAETLVISGADDVINPPEAGAELANVIPGARFVVYRSCGHMLYAEQPRRLAHDVAEFVRDAVPAGTLGDLSGRGFPRDTATVVSPPGGSRFPGRA